MKQYINKHKYWFLGILTSVGVCLVANSTNVKMISFLAAHFLVCVEGICIHTELEKQDNTFYKRFCLKPKKRLRRQVKIRGKIVA